MKCSEEKTYWVPQRRLWRLEDGAQLAELHGHGGRGVWRSCLSAGLLASAGADASIKLWPLADWLPRGGADILAAPALGLTELKPQPGGGGGGGGKDGGGVKVGEAAGGQQGFSISDLPLTPETPEGTGSERMSSTADG